MKEDNINKKNDGLGSINFLDIDESGKVKTVELEVDDKRISEIEKSSSTTREYTDDMKQMVAGTYVEKQEKIRKKEEEKKEKKSNFKIKLAIFALVVISLIIYSFISYSSIKTTIKERNINEKITFLKNNADYANDIKSYFTELSTNADNYQKNYLRESAVKSKANTLKDSIEKEILRLSDSESIFKKYGAEELYAILYGRLTEVQNLAIVQNSGGTSLDIAYKTNEFVSNENSNSTKYENSLKAYLTKNEIPFVEENGQLIYSVEKE